jgi:phospholipase C
MHAIYSHFDTGIDEQSDQRKTYGCSGFHVGRSHVNNAPDMESQTIYPTQRIPGLALRAFTLSAPCPSSNHRRLVTLNLLVLLALASSAGKSAANPEPTTPIRHVVVIYDENISFDYYFGTYPRAANGPGEVPSHASPGTPSVNGLSGVLLSRNPNSTNPVRLDRANAVTCDMDHAYSAEQKAYYGGLVNQVVLATTRYAEKQRNCDPQLVMGHYDGPTPSTLR